jgi:hypothetical protein
MRQARTTGVAPAVVAHVAEETGISRACAGKWVNRRRLHGDAGSQDRPSSPHRSPNTTPAWVIEQIKSWRRELKWSAQRITDELVRIGFVVDRRPLRAPRRPLALRGAERPHHPCRRREPPPAPGRRTVDPGMEPLPDAQPGVRPLGRALAADPGTALKPSSRSCPPDRRAERSAPGC